jgi:hypothetical protein
VHKLDDIKRRQTLMSSAVRSGNMAGSVNIAGDLSPQRKAANSAVVIGGSGFYKSNSASKVDFVLGEQNEDNKQKKDMASIEEMGGTITSDSII